MSAKHHLCPGYASLTRGDLEAALAVRSALDGRNQSTPRQLRPMSRMRMVRLGILLATAVVALLLSVRLGRDAALEGESLQGAARILLGSEPTANSTFKADMRTLALASIVALAVAWIATHLVRRRSEAEATQLSQREAKLEAIAVLAGTGPSGLSKLFDALNDRDAVVRDAAKRAIKAYSA